MYFSGLYRQRQCEGDLAQGKKVWSKSVAVARERGMMTTGRHEKIFEDRNVGGVPEKRTEGE